MMYRTLMTALGAAAIAGAAMAGTAVWSGFEDQMAAHAAAVAAAGAVGSAVGDKAVSGVVKGAGEGSTTLTAANPVDTRFAMMVESAATGLVARPYALSIILR